MADYDDSPVLFAYDGSEYAKTAIRQAARELRPGRRAIVLTVWQPFAPTLLAGGINLPNDLAAHVEDEARDVAAEGASLAREAGFEATPMVKCGEPVWQTVVTAAEASRASTVVLGSHGRSGIRALLMGSVATAAAQHTDRNVLIVHLPESSKAA
jgi:nucleotide-binding universal stress UspA family protein